MLNYGIAGAIVLRLIFIVLGVTIVNKFHWVLYIFGAILIISGIKMMCKQDECENYNESKIIKLVLHVLNIENINNKDRIYSFYFIVYLIYTYTKFTIIISTGNIVHNLRRNYLKENI